MSKPWVHNASHFIVVRGNAVFKNKTSVKFHDRIIWISVARQDLKKVRICEENSAMTFLRVCCSNHPPPRYAIIWFIDETSFELRILKKVSRWEPFSPLEKLRENHAGWIMCITLHRARVENHRHRRHNQKLCTNSCFVQGCSRGLWSNYGDDRSENWQAKYKIEQKTKKNEKFTYGPSVKIDD